MIVLILALLGALLGWRRATKAGGNRLDRMQYATVFAIIGVLTGLVLTIVIGWIGVA